MLGNFAVGLSVTKLLGSQRFLASLYMVIVSKFTSCCEMMCECAMVIMDEFVSFLVMKGLTQIFGLMRVEPC